MSDPAGNRTSLAGVRSGVGTAQGAASSGTVNVAVFGTVITMNAARDLSFAANDRLAFIKTDAGVWVAIARLDTAATTPPTDDSAPPPPPPKPTTRTGSKTFTPVETRSYRTTFGGWRTDTDDVYQGQYGGNGNHTGCAFYGNGPRSLAGATATSAKVKMRRRSSGGVTAAQDTTLWLVTQKTRPGGAPTLGSSTDGPNLRWGQSTTFTIPTAWAQSLIDGSAGGLAVKESDGSPYVILDGRSHYGASFSLTINWRRTS